MYTSHPIPEATPCSVVDETRTGPQQKPYYVELPCPIIFLNTNTNYMNLYGCMTNYIILFHENRWRCSTISSPALLRWRQNLTKAHGGSLTYALHCMLTGCYRLRATAAPSPAKEDQPKDKSFTIYDNGSKSSLTWP